MKISNFLGECVCVCSIAPHFILDLFDVEWLKGGQRIWRLCHFDLGCWSVKPKRMLNKLFSEC